VFDGVVRLSKPYAAYGNLIVIRHANGLESVYSHQSKNLVKSGDTVHAGQPIGLTGRSGRATTEHLHFEFRIDGQHFNPDPILDMQHRKLHPKTYRVTRTKEGIQLKPENEKQ
jgi:murein DD-endopeptidase MepM/ murein hydrolase activator NlpD